MTEVEELKHAMRKVLAHTAHFPDADRELLEGLLQNIQRIAQDVLRVSPGNPATVLGTIAAINDQNIDEDALRELEKHCEETIQEIGEPPSTGRYWIEDKNRTEEGGE